MQKNGFSLVELSIVLVILGLLTGGILAGQSLIRAAEIRAVSNEYTRYRTAIFTFRDRYMALPGDMPNAIKFWGRQAGADVIGMDATCRDLTAAATGTLTCNGNGDGLIAGNSNDAYETYRAWQHLANAGLIEGSYSGVTAGAANTHGVAIGTNSPSSRLGNAGYSVRSYPTALPADTSYFSGSYGNLLRFGSAVEAGAYAGGPVMTNEEVWGIDTKLDDGMPAIGMVRVTESSTSCYTGVEAAATYALSTSGKNCRLLLLLGL